MDQLTKYTDQGIAMAIEWVPQILLALATLFIGLWVIKGVTKLLSKTLSARSVDQTLSPFLCSLTSWGLKALLLVSVASMVGVETTSFVAVLGAAGLAVGLALQGSLSNFAGGVLILIFRPFQVGHWIEAGGHAGSVQEIQIFTTTLVNAQNRRIIIPNGTLSNNSIVNYTVEGRARVDLTVGVAYDADLDKAISLLKGMLEADPRVLKEPKPNVAVTELADSSVNLVVRPYVAVADYWGLYFDLQKGMKQLLDANGIGIPFPQREVRLVKDGDNS